MAIVLEYIGGTIYKVTAYLMDSGRLIGNIGGSEVADEIYGSYIYLAVDMSLMTIFCIYLYKVSVKFTT